MSLIYEEEINAGVLVRVAEKMLIAARTAPKGKGADNLVLALVQKEEIKKIAAKMKEIGEQLELNAFVRDSGNILCSPVMLILGTRIKSMGLKKCGMCGFKNCAEKEKNINVPCVFNTGDLGIAMGSAVSVAMDNRIDNRIMYTAGQAILDLGILNKDVKIIYCIPLSGGPKNIFFDRK